ncbi:MAG: hypothetical protein WD116_01465 [Chloroflexota bacterium]
MASAALVVLGVILVLLGIFAGNGSIPIIGLGVVSLIAAGYFQMMSSRKP